MSGVNIFLLEPKVLFICWSGSNISCDGPEVILTLFRVPLYQDQGTDRDTFADFGKKEGGGRGEDLVCTVELRDMYLYKPAYPTNIA